MQSILRPDRLRVRSRRGQRGGVIICEERERETERETETETERDRDRDRDRDREFGRRRESGISRSKIDGMKNIFSVMKSDQRRHNEISQMVSWQ